MRIQSVKTKQAECVESNNWVGGVVCVVSMETERGGDSRLGRSLEWGRSSAHPDG